MAQLWSRSMSPIPVSEPQYLAILNAANALSGCGCDREQFVAAVARELEGKPIGDGSVGVAIRAAQANFEHPTPPEKPSRWDRDRPRFESLSKRSAA
jgi:hypothetical protein